MAALGLPGGSLVPGDPADFLVASLEDPSLAGVSEEDLMAAAIFGMARTAVRDVYVDGRQVVANGKVLTLDHAAAGARLAEGQARMMAGVRSRDYLGRSADAITPLSLPLVP